MIISLPDDLPDDPVLLKQLLLEALTRQAKTAEVLQAHEGHIVDLKEQIKLLRDRLFGRKSEQTAEPNTPQLALFNEPESDPMLAIEDAQEEVVAPTARRGKRQLLSAELLRVEIIHELPEHELTCACGCRKHAVGEETSEQLDIVPMQIRVIRHIRKVYGCRGCEAGPVIHCDGARVQVLKEADRDPTSQSWMWVQASGPPDRKVVLFDYTSSRAQEVPLRLLDSYRGYVMTDDYAGYNALALQPGVERLACMAQVCRCAKSPAQGQGGARRYRPELDQQVVRHRA
ncbi:Transposase IS66 family protein [compost metagenome]